MNKPVEGDSAPDRIAQEAAAWVLRCDRVLTPAEQDAFLEWLAADPRHGAQLARHRRHWNRLDSLVQWRPEHSEQPNPDLLAAPPPRRHRLILPATLSVAAVAAIVVLLIVGKSPGPIAEPARPPSAAHATSSSAFGLRVLDDGTVVELNRGAAITVQFTAAERRVRLERGEAHFSVTKDVARPFVVRAAGIDVRAVGTAFNVRVGPAAVEVLVTEGRVQLDSEPAAFPGARPTSSPASRPPPLVPVLEARQRAVVWLGPLAQPPQVDTLMPGEIERVLVWQHRLLSFTDTPLREMVAEFNRRNVIQLIVVDPELASMRISATFRSDNIEGFVGMLEAGFDARAERRGGTEILLRKAQK